MMPTYEYYCPTNNKTIEVLHGMNDSIATWGALCHVAGIEQGETSANSLVERKLSAVSLLPKKGEGGQGSGGGCCGGGCGCGS